MRKISLFDEERPTEPYTIDADDAILKVYPAFFSTEEADLLFETVKREADWQQRSVIVYGIPRQMHRLTDHYGTMAYEYSGLTMAPKPWTPTLQLIKQRVEHEISALFNSGLLNWYPTGENRIDWHRDNERPLGKHPKIASLTFGAERLFQMRRRRNKFANPKKNHLDIILPHGSLFVMDGTTQEFWEHRLARTSKDVDDRLNLTLRRLLW